MHNLSPTNSSEKPSSLTAIPPFAFEGEEDEEEGPLLLVRLADLREKPLPLSRVESESYSDAEGESSSEEVESSEGTRERRGNPMT